MKKILLFVCLFVCVGLTSQTLTVRDLSTREGISDVIVTDQNKKSVTTNNEGKADISALDQSAALTFEHPLYGPQQYTVVPGPSAEVTLSSRIVTLDEVVLSANRTRERKIDVPYVIEVLKQKEIEFHNQPNAGDMLAATGNVSQQKSQLGGGSPNLRGFEASRVLLVVDGVRMNNAIYRAGHLQDIMTLDAQMIDRTEVIFGPSSTMYGSDALGGVMHFYTKNAQFSNNNNMLLKGNTMARYGSANNENTGHVDFNLGWKNFASFTSITYSRFGDLRAGSTKLAGYSNTWDRNYYVERFGIRDSMVRNENNNVMAGSAYSQTDIMQRFAARTGPHLSQNLNLQMSLNPSLPRFDRLAGDYQGANLRWAENRYLQNRFFGAYTINYDGATALSDNVRLILAYQDIDQHRITRRFRNNNRVSQMENVIVMSANLDVTRELAQKHELRYGAEFTGNEVTSTAKSEDIVYGGVSRADTRYAPENTMNTFAVYASHAYEADENLVITDGLRYTNTSLISHFTDTLPFDFPFEIAAQKSQALTGCLGFTWKAKNDYKFTLLGNTGFRTPNVDDMTKLFESGSVLIVANPTIKPEYAYNFESGLSKVVNGRFKFDLTFFYTFVDNYMTLKDFNYDGQDSVDYNGTKLKVQAMQNSDRSYLYGFNAGCQFDFSSTLSVKSTLNYTYGRYTDSKIDTVVPLDHIPPVFGQTSIMHRSRNTDAEFFVRYSGRKSLSEYSPSGEDNLQYATPRGMPGWFTLNVRAGYNLTTNFRLNFACENITNNRYRTFASGVNSPGRNFIVSLRYKL